MPDDKQIETSAWSTGGASQGWMHFDNSIRVQENSRGKAAFLKKGYAPPVLACRKADG